MSQSPVFSLEPCLPEILQSKDITDGKAHGYGSSNAGQSSQSPSYPLSVENLTTTSRIRNFISDTGVSIFQNAILPSIDNAEKEVIIATCFWAKSPTLDAIVTSLRHLSQKSLRQQKNKSRNGPIKVYLCFSSSSLRQKLFHPSRIQGKLYDPCSQKWQEEIGLPLSKELAGLDITVKSLFIRPLSAIHSKLIIVDRKSAFVPSCNVSWEEWLEGCVEVEGPIVKLLWQFWLGTWMTPETHQTPWEIDDWGFTEEDDIDSDENNEDATIEPTPTILLPSSHHVASVSRLLFSKPQSNAPSTPLNVFLLRSINQARSSIRIQTPNLTCKPVLEALLDALRRGVDVTIITNQRMQMLEQLISAKGTTGGCVKSLIRQYQKITDDKPADLEGDDHKAGSLEVFYLIPGSPWPNPQRTHIKLTVIDDQICILGSGNMDCASWYFLQEVGIAFHSTSFADMVWKDTNGMERKELLKRIFPL